MSNSIFLINKENTMVSNKFVKSGINSECYKVFREFLSIFVNQANFYNLKDNKDKRSQKLDGSEEIYPARIIEGILYKVQMVSNGSYGPKSGEGSGKLPYFGYRLSDIDNSWINIRCGFQRFKLTEFKIVKWYSNNHDEDLGYKYLVKDLELESTEEPNDILKEFYDNFTSFYRKKEKKDVNMLENINKYRNILLKSKNIILRGAPGTGKTYLAKEIALELTGGNEGQIEFVQFHPSYDYTDFVEGLRPILRNDGQINFALQDGIFKKFCQKAKESQKPRGQDNFDKAWDSYLAYINNSDEKEYLTKGSFLSVNSRQNLSVNYDKGTPGWSLSRNYVYELYKNPNFDKQKYYKSEGKKVLETLRKKFGLKEYVSPTDIDTDKKFVFIIDEINRGEISKIFGELFFSIDPGYRGRDGEVSTQYANLHETDEKFYIPENVYIIGTMNDIDRSVDTFDFAMRRRFRFVEVTAESQLYTLDKKLGENAEEAKARLRNLNAEIEKVQELNSHYHIGPSYFLKLEEVDFDYELLWSDYLKPLLEDYLRGSYEEDETLNTLKKAYDLTNQQDIGDEDADN